MKITRIYCDICHKQIPMDHIQADKKYLLPIYEDKYEETTPCHNLCAKCRQDILDLYESAKSSWENS